jgi:hypothetical protein
MSRPNLTPEIGQFLANYDPAANDALWASQSNKLRDFLKNRVMADDTDPISDDDCDEIIRILDRNGKGNTKGSQAVARVMIAQGAWRRMLNLFHANRELGGLVVEILEEKDPDKKAALIDRLYKVNEGQRNHLTGPSGNAVGAFLGAYDPINNLSVISLNDRRTLIEFLGLAVPFDWATASMGTKIVLTNKILLDGLRAVGLDGSARTVSRFCYFPTMRALWKGEHTVKRPDKDVNVTVPPEDDGSVAEASESYVSESMQIQALIAQIGTTMGFNIWLPKADRSRVLRAWNPNDNLLDELPLSYDPTTMKTIEQIDVLWLKNRSIVRAFEVEHTSSRTSRDGKK